MQLHNVVLLGPTKMALFAGLLQRRPPTLRRVKHLYLSKGATKASFVTRDEEEATLRLIFTVVAPELVTLANLLPQGRLGPDSILCIYFPKLVELTVHGHFLIPTSFASPGLELQPCFPSLTFLHILSSAESAYVYTSRAPYLSHLRLSALVRMPATLLDGLSRAIDRRVHETPEGDLGAHSDPFMISSAIQKIFVQPYIAMARFAYGHVREPDTQLLLLLKKDKRNKLVLVDEPPRSSRFDWVHRESEREMWTDRLVGGPGCWVEKPRFFLDDGRSLRSHLARIG